MGKVHENGAGGTGSLCKYECIFLNITHSSVNLREFTLRSDEPQSVTNQDAIQQIQADVSKQGRKLKYRGQIIQSPVRKNTTQSTPGSSSGLW